MSRALRRGRPPLDVGFYEELTARRSTFTLVSEHIVARGTGYGCRVSAGQVFRLVMLEKTQIIDLCLANAHDPLEHFAAGTQLALEGGFVSEGMRIWGTAPRSRPLAYVTRDTLRRGDDAGGQRDHICHGAHCNPHHWMLYTGTHPRTCYDNLRAGMAMLGLNQRFIHDNMNLFQRSALDPDTGGAFMDGLPVAEPGDYLEFFAEIDLNVVMSLCPQGSGEETLDEEHDVPYFDMPVYPVGVEVYDTGVRPLSPPS